jgi:hypothetical protein
MSVYSKTDIIEINRIIGEEGKLINPSSLDFALEKSDLNLLIRSIIVDHAFIDGNKRTAFIIILSYYKNYEIDKTKLVKILILISKNSITDLKEIDFLIKTCIGDNYE